MRSHLILLATFAEVAAYDAGVQDFYNSELFDFEEVVISGLRREQTDQRTPAAVEPVLASRIIVWGGLRAIERHVKVDDGSGDAAFAAQLARIWWFGAYRQPVNA